MNTEERLKNILQRLQKNGYRMTPQRVAILRAFISAKDHPTVEQIYRRVCRDFPMTSLATVYKTVALLKEMGEVIEISGDLQGSRYDAFHPEPHPHLICTQCGQIYDGENVDVQPVVAALQAQSAFQVSTYRLDLYGICARCQSHSNTLQ